MFKFFDGETLVRGLSGLVGREGFLFDGYL